jgi:hypothetical protein
MDKAAIWTAIPFIISFGLMAGAMGVVGTNGTGGNTYSFSRPTIGVIMGLSGGAAIALVIGLFLYISRFPAQTMTIIAIVCSFNLFFSLAALGTSVLIKSA